MSCRGALTPGPSRCDPGDVDLREAPEHRDRTRVGAEARPAEAVYLARISDPDPGRCRNRPDVRRQGAGMPRHDRLYVDQGPASRRHPSTGAWSDHNLVRSVVRLLEQRVAYLEHRLHELGP